MKKLSKRTRIIVLSILSVLVLALGVGIALSLLSYKDPVDQQPEVAPLGNYDYSKRPFFASSDPTIYNGDIYIRNSNYRLRRIPIDALSNDMRTSENFLLPNDYSVCADNSHDHNSEDDPDGCLDCGVGSFLIDAYESNGGSPIIYRTRIMDADIEKEDEFGVIIRYDTATMKSETVVSVSDAIADMMTYDNWLFFMTDDAEGGYSINVVSKKGDDIKTLELGKHGWNLMWATDDHVYYQDSVGNIYRATLDLQNHEFIFYAETISAMDSDRIGTFIHGDYLYFEADYETVPYPISVDGTQAINFAKHTIRRVPLNNLYGESEVVAENVLDNCVLGVGNNVLYYQPCQFGETKRSYYFNWTGGQLLGVNLKTLQQEDMINDIGLDFSAPDRCYAAGNALIVVPMPTDGRYNKDRHSGWGAYYFLYDIRTGALYPICGIM